MYRCETNNLIRVYRSFCARKRHGSRPFNVVFIAQIPTKHFESIEMSEQVSGCCTHSFHIFSICDVRESIFYRKYTYLQTQTHTKAKKKRHPKEKQQQQQWRQQQPQSLRIRKKQQPYLSHSFASLCVYIFFLYICTNSHHTNCCC